MFHVVFSASVGPVDAFLSQGDATDAVVVLLVMAQFQKHWWTGGSRHT